jgi:hypothetical protein
VAAVLPIIALIRPDAVPREVVLLALMASGGIIVAALRSLAGAPPRGG